MTIGPPIWMPNTVNAHVRGKLSSRVFSSISASTYILCCSISGRREAIQEGISKRSQGCNMPSSSRIPFAANTPDRSVFDASAPVSPSAWPCLVVHAANHRAGARAQDSIESLFSPRSASLAQSCDSLWGSLSPCLRSPAALCVPLCSPRPSPAPTTSSSSFAARSPLRRRTSRDGGEVGKIALGCAASRKRSP